ncbi:MULTISPECIES: DUF6952 family protein [Weeksella]|uniref:Uncharacterized protein n=1 Tax=Weeksella virosa (strain ATCC 43766 / DSM 16922 / JCM 21250 / CCUG 30538 / CDC 9751 / IAM 14551 / NBRC 16016 / NCTC 11634 / CL345/78) TaxID=865938 RepID=F0P2N3_WEEVC|nr:MULTISPECIES: hypothetical protein [Weeksella]ADX67872.1 hypothetical protein Weevi_1163 [Weeksella virosa DSM 16922]MDK7374161.1 hypothetical protein [Weeksella virosa]MDK7674473.1 hypothetical protein [Weeksella virosa]OFM82839.1 hypothetical protein HMPREF2660_04095 [Weeksella sp. HMSC059D05]SUP54175.1 Uncharacterised protein [Weeksella virosa]
MKLPVFKNLAKNVSTEDLEAALVVLESYAESPAVKEDEQEAIGEIISNICGAIEMKEMLNKGMDEREAANTFMQRVMGSIDR